MAPRFLSARLGMCPDMPTAPSKITAADPKQTADWISGSQLAQHPSYSGGIIALPNSLMNPSFSGLMVIARRDRRAPP